MTDPTEPEETCRPVEIDGEVIRVHGAAEMSEESQAALTEVIRAAKRRLETEQAERGPKQLRALAFNAVAPVLQERGDWLRLTTRRAVADAVLAVVQPELDALAALREVARGYCGTCGRGDAAPTVTDWEQQKQRADQAEAERDDARATNQRLNQRAQQQESELAAYRRAIAQWQIGDHGAYVPLRSLAAIAKAAGLTVPARWELHYQRVEHAEAALADCHALADQIEHGAPWTANADTLAARLRDAATIKDPSS